MTFYQPPRNSRKRRIFRVAVAALVFVIGVGALSSTDEPIDTVGDGLTCYHCNRTFLWDDQEAVNDAGRWFCCAECAEDFRSLTSGGAK